MLKHLKNELLRSEPTPYFISLANMKTATEINNIDNSYDYCIAQDNYNYYHKQNEYFKISERRI
jgi:hypothetical protein